MKTVVYLSHYVSAELFMNQEKKKGIKKKTTWVCPIGILKKAGNVRESIALEPNTKVP